MTVTNHLGSWLRRQWFSAHGVRLHPTCRIGPQTSLHRGFKDGRKGAIALEHDCELSQGICLHAWGGEILISPHVFVGPYTVIYGHGGVEIGDACLIAMHCRILSSNHAVPPFGTDIRSQPDIFLPTKIGRDVWLGAGVTVLGGVTIGDGCVVGAGSVVTKDLPSGSLAVGVPAQVTGWRDGSPH